MTKASLCVLPCQRKVWLVTINISSHTIFRLFAIRSNKKFTQKMEQTEDFVGLVDTGNNFGIKFCQNALASNTSNGMCSPLGLCYAVAAMKLGAKETGVQQLQKIWPMESTLEQKMSEVMAEVIKSCEGIDLLKFASRVFTCQNFDDEFKQKVSKMFLNGVEFETLDFSKIDDAMKVINNWVKSSCPEMDMISKDSIAPDTSLAMANTVHLKGKWKEAFDPSSTMPVAFYVSATEKVTVELMYAEKRFPYTKLDSIDAHAAAIPYKGDRIYLVVILPNKRKTEDGVSKILNALSSPELNPKTLLSKMEEYQNQISLFLPKFKLQCQMNCSKTLRQMGADAISSEVLQSVLFEVDEDGDPSPPRRSSQQESGNRIMWNSPQEVFEFYADHPFVFQVVDKLTSMVLLSGVVNNPNV